ncbi:MAG: alpha/beta fold hydrolase [Pseudomonadota bacterium]
MTAQSGLKPPVVFLHGGFCAGWAFDDWRKLFEAEGYETWAPSLPHHEIDWPEERPPDELATLGLRAYTEHVAALVDNLDAPPIVVGHSLGGLIAQLLAARRRLAGLVLLAPSAPWGVMPSSLREAFTPAAMTLMVGPYWLRTIPPDFAVAMENCFHLTPRRVAARAFDRFVPESGLATFETWHWTWDPRRSSWVSPRAVKAPVLVMVGEEDRVNPAATAQSIARRYECAADGFRAYPGHAHWLIEEDGWERIANEALSWIGRLRTVETNRNLAPA